MRRTVWTLLLALLLQLGMGSAWAMRSAQPLDHAPHCHEVQSHDQHAAETHHTLQGKHHASSMQADGHHCCAIGLGIGIQPRLQPLPQATPVSSHDSWISQSLSPDLRPPI